MSGGCGCLGEGRLGFPGQAWELRFLSSFPLFPRENCSLEGCLGKRLEVPDILLPDICDQPKMESPKRGCDLGTCVVKRQRLKKRIAIISYGLEASLGARACVQFL